MFWIKERARRCTGFTLIELLVVILIICILIAALMPLWGKITMQAKRTETIARIQGLTTALEKYRVQFDAYPPNPSSGTEDDGTLFTYLCGADGRGVVSDSGTPREKHFEAFLTFGANSYKHNNDKLVLVDSWGTPLHYYNCKAYVDGGGNPDNCHKPDKCDIWSYGPDKMKDAALIEPGNGKVEDPAKELLVDDITNWGSKIK